MTHKSVFVFLTCGLLALETALQARAGVVFSEIMYRPPASATNTTDGDDFEFLELHNTGASSISLAGAYFSSGIAFTNPAGAWLTPGAYGVLVKNRAAFTNRYPSVTNILGGYTGSLANGGEKITLKKSDGSTLFSVTYSDTAPWPAEADGLGASLVLTNETGAPDDAANWARSDDYLGTPGRAGPGAVRDIVINEILAHTDLPDKDAIELHNTTAAPITVNGWYLSDDAVARTKYRLTNATIAAHGYIVLTQDQFHDTGDTNTQAFALSESGDSVFLTAASGSNLTRFVDHVAFEAQENGVALGRYPNATGEFTPMATQTPGTLNSDPRVGPLVINEIMYHPPGNLPDDEYIELLSVTNAPLPLFDPDHPVNTWRLTTAVTYVFPTNTVVLPHGRVLVVGATNPAAFRAAHAVPEDVPIFGPWNGQLNNAGDSIQLVKPGIPETNGVVPYYQVDRVVYHPTAPWPTAPDGQGPSLERVEATRFGNTPDNWYVGPPGGSPGYAPAGGFVDPVVLPPAPAAFQSFTVTVAVVAQSVPSQVVMRTSIQGTVTNWLMRDNGTGGDRAPDDRVYSAVVPGLSNGTWVYFSFRSYMTNGETFALPAGEIDYLPSPTLTVTVLGGDPSLTVQPTSQWMTHQTEALLTHDTAFYIQLAGAGEALVDDVALLDAGGTNHIRNGSFDNTLSGTWLLNGNHSNSVQAILPAENSNRVLHVKAPAPPVGWENVSQFMDPPMVTGTTGRISFRTRQVSREVAPWFWIQVGTPAKDVVINEIMYHPDRTNEWDHEYVELFNPAASTVDLSGWTLQGVGLTFPTGTVIAAGGYRVCGFNPAVLQATHGINAVIGPWTGQLDNGGETLTLSDAYGRPVDAVTYSDSDPWPVAADGYGPALERIHPAWPGASATTWAASAASTDWQLTAVTNVVGAPNACLGLYLDYDGKCRVDDISLRALGGGVELVTNGTFEAGLQGWTPTNNHSQSRVVAGTGRGGGQALALVGNASRWTPNDPPRELILYGDGHSNGVFSAPLPTMPGTNYVLSWWARRQGLGGPMYGVVGGVTGRVSFSACGTPGTFNSTASDIVPFSLDSVSQSFDAGPAGSTNIIRCRVSPAGAATTVQCLYRVVGSNTYSFSDAAYSAIVMRDDGLAPDQVASNGEFACYGPVVTSAWQLVRYHVAAQGTNGITVTRPDPDDPGMDYSYWVQGNPVQTQLPDWYLMVDGNPVAYPFVRRACAIAPNGQSFTDVQVRHRGRIETANTAYRTGIALRLWKSRLLNAWFANKQEGINFRNRMYNSSTDYTRVVNEWLGYDVQRLVGFPAPRNRHVCLWINGAPTVTVELEDPEEDFLKGHAIGTGDLVTRIGWTGRKVVGGDPGIDNFAEVMTLLGSATGAARTSVIRSNLCYESVQHSLALLAVTANADQFFQWNMFQQRHVADGRWVQYPWDVDMSFRTDTIVNGGNTNRLPQLHPYYQTPLHPSIWDATPPPSAAAGDLGKTLFYPETGPGSEFTLPYRHRQQMALWRHYHTLQETNFLFPKVDGLQAQLLPVFAQLGLSVSAFTNQVASVKQAISSRRDFLMNGAWSDKDPAIWNSANVYVTTNIVINEIMCDPPAGGEYLELYNRGSQAVDLSQWTLQVGTESYRLPFGTMMGPTSYLVVADTQQSLTNYFTELGDADSLIQRYPGTPLWDWPVVWTAATEYASRVVELPTLTLPNSGAIMTLSDLTGTLVDTVTYGTTPPWPTNPAAAFELVDAESGNNTGTAWRSSSLVGTPGWVNTAATDRDADGLPDAWEQLIVDFNPADGISHATDVAQSDDFDHDGAPNLTEYVAGTDPTSNDVAALRLRIGRSNAVIRVEFDTRPIQGENYLAYEARLYTLDGATHLLHTNAWGSVTNFTHLAGFGQTVLFTNSVTDPDGYYRYRIELQPRR